jgi:hypothetical protein
MNKQGSNKMTTYAQIPVSRFENMLRVLNQSMMPPSFVIKKLPGMGVLSTIRTVYPDAGVVTTNHLETDSMSEKFLIDSMTLQSEKLLIVDLDIGGLMSESVTIGPKLALAMRDYIVRGNRLIVVSSSNVIIPETLINHVLATNVS